MGRFEPTLSNVGNDPTALCATTTFAITYEKLNNC